MSKLVIVESPTKAKTITKFLGKGFKVESSFGHIRDLPKSKMGVDIEGGTFEPEYVIPPTKKAQVAKLKKLAKGVDEIIFASDEDREGEAISWHLAHALKIKPENAKRIVFHEITKHAIEEALKTPRKIDQNLVNSQQARRILDRLVGYELSPLLWKKIARGLSAGRVQSVAVRLTVEREREIQKFKADEYWTLEAMLNKDAHEFIGKLHSRDGKNIKKLDIGTKDKMDEILAELEGAEYKIEKIEKKETTKTPPAPFTTSTLQQTAHNAFGYSSKQIMVLAQQLYEGVKIGNEQMGLITYMRTDSTNLSTKFLDETNNFVKKTYGDKYTILKARIYKTKSKGAQEAHEAIRPSDPSRTPESIKDYLDTKQFKIYELIWKRAVATQMSPAKLDRTSINTKAKKYIFRTTGQIIIFDGWLKLYPNKIKHEMLPDIAEGTTVNCKELKPEQHFTEPPARYSDATLVKALEEYGIGRPSTFAPTIDTIEHRNYVIREENKRLKPTDVAFLVSDLLVEHFPDIVDYNFTAQMEQNLDDIAEGKADWQPIISTFYHPFHDLIVEKEETLKKSETVGMRELGIDPKTNKPVYVRIGRYGPFAQLGSKDDEEKPKFAKLNKNQSIDTIKLEEALHLLSLPKIIGQDKDGHDVLIGAGRFGPYVKIEENYYSIKGEDPYEIKMDRAMELVKENKEKKAKQLIKEFKEEGILVKIGRYGAYTTDGKINATIPKDTDPKSLTLEDCKKLIEEKTKNPRRGKRKKK